MSESTLTPAEKDPIDRRDLVCLAVDGARTPMVICAPRQTDNPIILANRAFLDLTGYQKDEVIGRNCRFLQGPLTDRGAIDSLRAAIADAREVEVELLNYRKDGSAFWNRVSLSPVHDENGRLIYFFGSQVDVTQQRLGRIARDEDSQVLLREIDHRAMNALAIVEGIVRLSRAPDTKAYAAAVQQRVQSLAKAHAFLSARRWSAAPLRDVVQLQIAQVDPRRATLDGPEILVGATMIQPLALVLHEMIVNAASHGCLSSAAGRLAVRWAPHNGDRGFHMVWEETGGPPPPQERTPGFGAAMIAAIIERQLRGQARLDWQDTGLRAEFRVPNTAREPKRFELAAGR